MIYSPSFIQCKERIPQKKGASGTQEWACTVQILSIGRPLKVYFGVLWTSFTIPDVSFTFLSSHFNVRYTIITVPHRTENVQFRVHYSSCTYTSMNRTYYAITYTVTFNSCRLPHSTICSILEKKYFTNHRSGSIFQKIYYGIATVECHCRWNSFWRILR